MKVLGDRVLVRENVEEVSKGGILLPHGSTAEVRFCTVVAVSDSAGPDFAGEVAALNEAETVLLSQYAGTNVNLDGVDHLIVNIVDILGIV